MDSIHGNEKLICHFAEWFLGSFKKINFEHHSMDNPNGGFYKLDEIGNNDNIGIRGFTT